MLGFLNVQPLDLHDKANYGVVDLINSIFTYFKTISVSILPKELENKDKINEVAKELKDQDQVNTSTNTNTNTNNEEKELFPKVLNYDETLLQKTSAIPCSTVHQPIFKMENNNDNGVISWDFSHHNHNHNHNNPESNLFNNDSFILKYNDDIPDLPNPEFFDIELNKPSVDSSELSISPSTSDLSNFESEKERSSSNISNSGLTSIQNKKGDYICEFCGAEFKIRGYLTRHIKKHALNKAYECPFYDEDSNEKCHPNGGFSRRDTYKTHLKARHFKYPKGTRSLNRSTTPGHCASCLKHFDNNEIWVEKHIENGECKGLPKNYQIRGKNTRRKQYEFPNSNSNSNSTRNTNGINSPISLNSNSPDHDQSHNIQQQLKLQQLSSPSNNQIQIHIQNQLLQNNNESPISIDGNMSIIDSNNNNNHQFINNELSFQKDNEIYNFDDNDEFSLDVEQCLSYRPSSH